MNPNGISPATKHVIQGEHVVSGAVGTVFATILGSCVAVCLHDPFAEVGGMNHFLLPGEEIGHRSHHDDRYGVHLMEVLVNDLMRIGARRERLQAKLFGGARIVRGLSDIGKLNGEFAERYLHHDGIRIVGKDLGGEKARRLQYWPFSGRARQMYVAAPSMLAKTEIDKAAEIQVGDEIELF